MRIENITTTDLEKLNDNNLFHLRRRSLDIYSALQKNKNMGISRAELIEKYLIINSEMNKRGLKRTKEELDDVVFKKTMLGLDVASLDKLFIKRDLIFLTDKSKEDSFNVYIENDNDLFTKKTKEELQTIIELELDTKVNLLFTKDLSEEEFDIIPLYDLALIPKNLTERIKKKIEKKTKLSFSQREDKIQRALAVALGKKEYDIWLIDTYDTKVIYREGNKERYLVKYKIEKDETITFDWTTKKEVIMTYVTKGEDNEINLEEGFDLMKVDIEGETIPFDKIDKDKQIVGGIVYSAGTKPDAQGDVISSLEELRKASDRYMIKSQGIKKMHKGEFRNDVRVIENFVTDKATEHMGIKIPKDSWWLLVKVNDKELWKEIREGKMRGWSMGGRAQGKDLK